MAEAERLLEKVTQERDKLQQERDRIQQQRDMIQQERDKLHEIVQRQSEFLADIVPLRLRQ